MGHTPGPWIMMEGGLYGEIRDLDTFTVIAKMPEFDDREDDFRLIAAAPELLAACEFALDVFRSWPDMKPARTKLEAAIAQAKGQGQGNA